LQFFHQPATDKSRCSRDRYFHLSSRTSYQQQFTRSPKLVLNSTKINSQVDLLATSQLDFH
jgi:hypothetical protein